MMTTQKKSLFINSDKQSNECLNIYKNINVAYHSNEDNKTSHDFLLKEESDSFNKKSDSNDIIESDFLLKEESDSFFKKKKIKKINQSPKIKSNKDLYIEAHSKYMNMKYPENELFFHNVLKYMPKQ